MFSLQIQSEAKHNNNNFPKVNTSIALILQKNWFSYKQPCLVFVFIFLPRYTKKMYCQIFYFNVPAVWPDVGIKGWPNSSNRCPTGSQSKFYLKLMFSKIAQNVTKNLGYIFNQIYDRQLFKIAQSGHTALPVSLSYQENLWSVIVYKWKKYFCVVKEENISLDWIQSRVISLINMIRCCWISQLHFWPVDGSTSSFKFFRKTAIVRN